MVAFTDLRFDYRIFREASSLKQAGHRITLVVSAFQPGLPKGWEAFELHLLPVNRSRSLRCSYPLFWYQAYRLLMTIRADVYHAHDLDALWPAALAARHWSAPLIYDSHEFWSEQSSLTGRPFIRAFWVHLEQRLIRQARCTIAVSESIARALQKRYLLKTVAVVRNLPLYRPPLESNRIRAELNLPRQQPIVLYQGGFLTDNGLSEQIQAAASFGNAAFVLIGDGPCKESLKRQVQKANLQDKVFFIPRVPFQELHAYTCSADLGLCLIKGKAKSFYYSMPNKLFEYLLAGLPVLASDFPEMRQVILETGAGEVVDPLDIEAIGRRVRNMLCDSERRQVWRQAALQAARYYCWERESHRLIQLYETL